MGSSRLVARPRSFRRPPIGARRLVPVLSPLLCRAGVGGGAPGAPLAPPGENPRMGEATPQAPQGQEKTGENQRETAEERRAPPDSGRYGGATCGFGGGEQ